MRQNTPLVTFPNYTCEIFLMNMWNIPSGLSSCGASCCAPGKWADWRGLVKQSAGWPTSENLSGCVLSRRGPVWSTKLRVERGKKKRASLQHCNGRVATMESVTARSAALVKWDAALAIHTVIIPPHVFRLLYRWNGGMKAGINKKWFSFKLGRINYSAPLCW